MKTIHTLKQNDVIQLKICAIEEWSSDVIATKAGEKYHVWCNPGESWTDWFIKSSPKGFFNILASIVGLRVKGVKCFCLCGGYQEDINTAFPIENNKEFEVDTAEGQLSFFANDSPNHYKNNKGSIIINVKRIV